MRSEINFPFRLGKAFPVTLLLLVVVGIFAPSLGFQFLNYDDFLHVYENQLIVNFSWSSLARFWSEPYQGLYMPLTYTCWGALSLLSGMVPLMGMAAEPNPVYFHAFNLTVHAATVIVLFLFLLRLLGDQWGAFVGALLFAVHPVQVEAVVWVSSLKVLLGGLFALLALLCYHSYAESGLQKGRWLAYGSGMFFLTAGLLATPFGVVIPFLAFAVGRLALQRHVRQLFCELTPWVILACPIMVVTKLAQPDAPHAFLPAFGQRLLVAGDALTFYLGKILWPLVIAPDYGRTPSFVLQHSWVYLTALLSLAGAVIFFWLVREHLPRLAFVLFIVPLLPVLGLLSFYFQKISTVADRYLYLALVGAALMLGWTASRHRRWAVTLPLLAILTMLGLRSVFLLPNWRDSVALNSYVIEINPGSSMGHNNLGVAYLEAGRVKEAIEVLQHAKEIESEEPDAYVNLGNVYQESGRFDEAIKYYLRALELAPSNAMAHLHLGEIFQARRSFEQALVNYRLAVAADPDNARSHASLGVVARELGLTEEAREHYRQALRINPEFAEVYNNLGQLEVESAHLDEALLNYRQALRLNPELGEVYNNLGSLYLRLGQPTEALPLLLKAREIFPEHPLPYHNLAEAYLQLGQVEQASSFAEQARSLGFEGATPSRVEGEPSVR